MGNSLATGCSIGLAMRVALAVCCCLFSFRAMPIEDEQAGEGPVEPAEVPVEPVEAPEEPQKERKWFFIIGAVNVYPMLESEDLLERFFDGPMRVVTIGHDDTKRFGDMRDGGLMWPPQVSVGRILNDHWAVAMHGGYSAGKVVTRQTNPTILFIIPAPVHSDVEIARASTYIGLDLDYYPLGMVDLRKYKNWTARLKGAKPSLGLRLTGTYTTYDATVKLGIPGLGNIIKVKLDDAWLLGNITTVVGVDVPLNRRNALVINAGYNFFFGRKYDFNGSAVNIGWRFHF